MQVYLVCGWRNRILGSETVLENLGRGDPVPSWSDGWCSFRVSPLVLKRLEPCYFLPKCLIPSPVPQCQLPSTIPSWVCSSTVLGSRVAERPCWSLRKFWDPLTTIYHWVLTWLLEVPYCLQNPYDCFSTHTHTKLCPLNIYTCLCHISLHSQGIHDTASARVVVLECLYTTLRKIFILTLASLATFFPHWKHRRWAHLPLHLLPGPVPQTWLSPSWNLCQEVDAHL